QRREALVQLGRDEVEPLGKAIAFGRARGGRERRLRPPVGDVLHDRRALGEDPAVVELERRHVALGIHGEKIAATGELVLPEVDLLEGEGDARLAQRDVRRQGAGSGCVVELHRFSVGCVMMEPAAYWLQYPL